MTTATLSRGSETVTIHIKDSSDKPVLLRDVGKPNMIVHEKVGHDDPIVADQWSGLDAFTVFGELSGPERYSEANTLASLVKSHYDTNALYLDLGELYPTLGTFEVGVTESEALSIDYTPGQDWVEIKLTCFRVSATAGA